MLVNSSSTDCGIEKGIVGQKLVSLLQIRRNLLKGDGLLGIGRLDLRLLCSLSGDCRRADGSTHYEIGQGIAGDGFRTEQRTYGQRLLNINNIGVSDINFGAGNRCGCLDVHSDCSSSLFQGSHVQRLEALFLTHFSILHFLFIFSHLGQDAVCSFCRLDGCVNTLDFIDTSFSSLDRFRISLFNLRLKLFQFSDLCRLFLIKSHFKSSIVYFLIVSRSAPFRFSNASVCSFDTAASLAFGSSEPLSGSSVSSSSPRHS